MLNDDFLFNNCRSITIIYYDDTFLFVISNCTYGFKKFAFAQLITNNPMNIGIRIPYDIVTSGWVLRLYAQFSKLQCNNAFLDYASVTIMYTWVLQWCFFFSYFPVTKLLGSKSAPKVSPYSIYFLEGNWTQQTLEIRKSEKRNWELGLYIIQFFFSYKYLFSGRRKYH